MIFQRLFLTLGFVHVVKASVAILGDFNEYEWADLAQPFRKDAIRRSLGLGLILTVGGVGGGRWEVVKCGVVWWWMGCGVWEVGAAAGFLAAAGF